MAASAGIASALLGPLAPVPLASPAAAAKTDVTPTAKKTMEELLAEIETLKTEVSTATKTLEKIETSKKKASANRERSVEGRTQVRDLTERVSNLQKQMDAMTKDSDPSYPGKKFEKSRKSALKTLTSLGKDLTQVDKHLEKGITAALPVSTASPADVQSTAASGVDQPVAAPRASPEKENSKGVAALIKRLPLGKKKKKKKSLDSAAPSPAKPTDEIHNTEQKKSTGQVPSEHEEDADDGDDDDEEEDGQEEEQDSDDDDVVAVKKHVPEKPPAIIKKPEPIAVPSKKSQVSDVDSDGSEYSDEDDDDINDYRQLHSELQSQTPADVHPKDVHSQGHRSRSPTIPYSNKKVPAVKTDLTPSSSPKMKKTATIVPPTPPSRKKTQSPKGRPEVPIVKKKKTNESEEEDSYYEEDEREGGDHDYNEDEEEEELQHLHKHDEHEEEISEHEYDEQEEEPTSANAHVQELRTNKYSPGTQFIVTHDLIGEQTGDLTVHRGDILTLVEQRPDDWWLFKNVPAQLEGLVPINLIQLYSKQQIRQRIKPSTSVITLVDAFKNKNNIPDGFIASDLAPLTKIEEYQLWRALVPKMTESNLAFTDLYWRADTDKLYAQEVIHQKILTLKECVKIPRIKGEEVRVLDRCVRLCLCDGLDIVSNIHTVRAIIPSKIDPRELTEDWHFARNSLNTLIDEQSELLMRSNFSGPGQKLKLLIELSQWCQSTVTQEKCEIGCGWAMVSIDDVEPPLITDTKNYNELLRGGHTDQEGVLLDPQYKVLRSNGISGMIDRYKRARVKFSIESRENDVDILYDNLPIQSTIAPMNAIKPVAFFRNELAFQFHKRHHPTGLSTTPIDSIFLGTFFQALSQADLIYTLNRIFRIRKARYLSASSSSQQQRELFIKVYEQFIYPLLQYRQLPTYDFHDIASLNERRNLINDIIKRQTAKKKAPAEDILSILLDPNLTDKWTPFTTDELCFTLQKYIHDSIPDVVA
ncbi:unnamed protein product [Rotaria socialis]|uniref:SH3 domain-containing protein n=1 Tax=Rotaria socialis TaxID=392032 RepID=A0A820BR35_9BILA|nr:unnamed protein product [Rotaria socialis]CAF3405142.1 unnamed protein product [Rotaria socialis]CAF3492257.1 unnamed protein product [Rotaria socialis]CAF4195748.1 unnamed protein product [Rotaria socialis]CAF4360811.1 unnamed protein product [Rotaria socialis]